MALGIVNVTGLSTAELQALISTHNGDASAHPTLTSKASSLETRMTAVEKAVAAIGG